MKTTSKELSIALKEAGAKQESYLYWWENTRTGKWETAEYYTSPYSPNDRCDCEDDWVKRCSSFDCHELLDGMSACMVAKNEDGRYWVEEFATSFGWENSFHPCDTPAEALGKLKLWCLQNGNCDE